jgi:hypothetical protein
MRPASSLLLLNKKNREVLSKKLIIIDDENHQTATQSNLSFLFRVFFSHSHSRSSSLPFREALGEHHHHKNSSNLLGN